MKLYENTKIISGIRPSGRLHLGNYIGSILPAVKYDADVLIAHYHAPHGNAPLLLNELLNYFAPDKIKMQAEVFNGQLYFELLEVTATGMLNHMPQYKEKEKNALMFTYPVLMAHDIAGYDFVIVGDDQKPHIEFANDILHRIGFTCPQPIYEGGRVMDLRHPEQKMSKSNPESCLFLSDPFEVMQKKVQKAVTDEAGRKNLEFIYHSLGGQFPIPLRNDLLKSFVIDQLKQHFHKEEK